MQVGSPAEIYSEPKNLFVAGFIGQPSINTVKGRIENGRFKSDGGGIDIASSMGNTENVTMAIRPEHLEYAEETDGNFTAKVIGHEDHGHEAILFFEVEGCTWAFRTKERYSGGLLTLSLPQESILYFDNEGERIRN
jgi:ABC-type sugar transport system ATPase subunit